MKTIELVKPLAAIVGESHVLDQSKLQLRNPGQCEQSQTAALLVRPANAEELSEVIKIAAANNVQTVPQGGLTGLVQATSTEADNLIISFERMNKITRVDPLQGVLVAGTGVTLADAHAAAAEVGMTLGVDIPSRGSCTLGGIISTNAGGIRVIRYGMTRENVLGLTAVLADGTIIDAGNTLMKNNAGYDLKHLFIGSEGTLGMVTSAVFKLFPLPVREHTALIATDSVESLLELLKRCRQEVGSSLLSFEGLWKDFYWGKTKAAGIRAPIEDPYPIYGIVEAGVWRSGDNVNPLEQTLSAALEDGLIADAVLASSESERREIWDIREDGEPLSKYGKHIQSFDVGFELGDIDSFVTNLYSEMSKKWPDKPVFVFGHVGDGNLHVCLANNDEEHERRHEFEDVLYQVTARFANSTVSAEHGIGLEKKPYLQHSRSTEQLALMAKVRGALDPESMFNPGKIF